MISKKLLESQLEELKSAMPDVYASFMAAQAEAEEAKILKKAMAESSEFRTRPVIMDPERNYEEEITKVVTDRCKGTKDPEISLKDGEIAVMFDNFGPMFKLRISAPLRRFKPKTGPHRKKSGQKLKRIE